MEDESIDELTKKAVAAKKAEDACKYNNLKVVNISKKSIVVLYSVTILNVKH